MNLYQAVILSVIQGLTEFLPVSSSGHLVLGARLFGLPSPGLTFSIWVHVGTAFATIVMLRAKIYSILRGMFFPGSGAERKRSLSLVAYVVAASVPAGIVGLAFDEKIEACFSSTIAASAGLIVTGCILYLSKSLGTLRNTVVSKATVGEDPLFSTVTLQKAMAVGVSQAVAIVPGISRSGTTITTGLLSGMAHKDAAEFSFLLSLPAVLGAVFLDVVKAMELQGPVVEPMSLVGACISFIVGLAALRIVFRTVEKGELHKFSYYCWIVGTLGVILSLLFV